MHIPNLKFHAVAVSAICAVVVVAYAMMGPPAKTDEQGKPLLRGDRYIQIDSATWGRNCDPYIDQALKTWKPDPAKPTPRPHRVVEGNALLPVSEICNGKLTCKFSADSEVLRDDPLPSCSKQLALRYRCFAYEPFIAKSVGQHETVTIDCTPKAVSGGDAPSPAKP